jgi:hypothetical protein
MYGHYDLLGKRSNKHEGEGYHQSAAIGIYEEG